MVTSQSSQLSHTQGSQSESHHTMIIAVEGAPHEDADQVDARREMSGFHLLPTTLLATVVAFVLTGEVGLIHTQREHDAVGERPE